MSGRRAIASTGAVLAGLVVIVALSTAADAVLHATHVFPAPGDPMSAALWVLASGYRFAFAVAGGWVTARLSPEPPMPRVIVLGVIGVVLSALGAAATWDKGPGFGPRWYPLSLVLTALPSVWLGGWLRGRGVAALRDR